MAQGVERTSRHGKNASPCSASGRSTLSRLIADSWFGLFPVVFALWCYACHVFPRYTNDAATYLSGLVLGMIIASVYLLCISSILLDVEVNRAFLQQMNCTRKEVIGRRCYEVFHSRNHRCTDNVLVCPLDEVIRNKRHTRHGIPWSFQYR